MQISTTGIQRVLQLLLAERVSIRDLGAILEGIGEVAGTLKNPRDIVEHVRTRLARQICAQYAATRRPLPIITLSPAMGERLRRIHRRPGRRPASGDAALQADRFVRGVRDRFEDAARIGDMPVLVTSVRPGPSSARSSSASAARPRSCHRARSIRGYGSRRLEASRAGYFRLKRSRPLRSYCHQELVRSTVRDQRLRIHRLVSCAPGEIGISASTPSLIDAGSLELTKWLAKSSS